MSMGSRALPNGTHAAELGKARVHLGLVGSRLRVDGLARARGGPSDAGQADEGEKGNDDADAHKEFCCGTGHRRKVSGFVVGVRARSIDSRLAWRWGSRARGPVLVREVR